MRAARGTSPTSTVPLAPTDRAVRPAPRRSMRGRAPAAGRRRRGPGRPVSGSLPDCDFGNAITSRIASLPARIITRRSTPIAMPPWGGAPSARARSRCPNCSSTSSGGSWRASKTLRWVAASWMRMLPPPTSKPFSTRSYARALAVSRGQIVGGGRRERVVHRDPAVLLVAVLEQRRLDHPAERPRIVGDQPEPRGQLAAETVERHVGPVLPVGDDADEVAVGGAGPLHDPCELLGREELLDGRADRAVGARRPSRRAPRHRAPWHPRSIGRAPCARTTPRPARRAP